MNSTFSDTQARAPMSAAAAKGHPALKRAAKWAGCIGLLIGLGALAASAELVALAFAALLLWLWRKG